MKDASIEIPIETIISILIGIFIIGLVFYSLNNATTKNIETGTTTTQTTTTSTITSSTTTTMPQLNLNITAKMLIENPRWYSLPIYVYIDNKTCENFRNHILSTLAIWNSETVVDFEITSNSSCDNCVDVVCFTASETNSTEQGGYIYTTVGEGQITQYYPLGDLNIIKMAEVIIYETSKSCIRPVRYLHEFGHILGFAHTDDTKSIMYQYEDCSEVITDEIKNSLAELYSNKADEYLKSILNEN